MVLFCNTTLLYIHMNKIEYLEIKWVQVTSELHTTGAEYLQNGMKMWCEPTKLRRKLERCQFT